MKLLTLVIPSYNSERYLTNCLDSLLIGLDDVLEVIVVNDGSTDNTSKIAHEYADKYDFIKVIDKENGGHGSGINAGLDVATGLFFKILDSDDGMDKEGLTNLIEIMKKHIKENNVPDLYLADYYCVPDDGSERVITSVKSRVKELNTVHKYDGFKKIKESNYFMTHMLYIKLECLKKNNVRLLEKCFYEDTQYTLYAFMICDTFCYVDKPIYLYTVGRAGQSVSLEKVANNYHYQLRVSYECVNMLSTEKLNQYDKCQQRIIMHEFNTIFYLTFFFCHIRATKEKQQKYGELVETFKKKDLALYKRVFRHSLMFWFTAIPYHLRGKATDFVYKTCSKKFGWR